MKSFRLLLFPLLAGGLFVLTSCGSNEEKTTTDTVSTETTMDTTTTATTAPPTTDTTALNMMVAMHKVKNFNEWKASYDAHDSLRQAYGIHSYAISRGVQDSNMVMVATTVDDLAKAREFGKSATLKQAMQKGGVTGTPTIRYITFRERNTAAPGMELRSMSTFTVKDWDTWKRSFDSGRQLRMEYGLMDRAVGHDADDSKKVTVVVAITDSAKARTYWNSDTLKKRRAMSGVVSEPKRFIYQVVQRY